MTTDVVYWDSSAVLSVLLRDAHSDTALAYIRRPDVHILSTLAWAEVHAVMARHLREGTPDSEVSRASGALERVGWRHLRTGPSRAHVSTLARRWSLQGADLWHLATARTIADEVRVSVLTFDRALDEAANGEGMGIGSA